MGRSADGRPRAPRQIYVSALSRDQGTWAGRSRTQTQPLDAFLLTAAVTTVLFAVVLLLLPLFA
jgi:hypothetical protein